MTMRVLLIAPYADRDDVGESRSTWDWVDRLSRRASVDILTYARVGRAPAVRMSFSDAQEVACWSEPFWLPRLGRIRSMAKPGLVHFAAAASRWIRRRGGMRRFDLVHQISPLAPRHGPLVSPEAGVPFVLGPLAGSLPTPKGFRHDIREPWFIRLRSIDGVRFRIDPVLRSRYSRVSHVLGVAPYVQGVLRHCYSGSFSVESEIGVAAEVGPEPIRPVDHLRILFVGRLIRTKGVRDLVAAVLDVPEALDVRLDVVGDGEERPILERMVSKEDRLGRVRLHGRVSRTEVNKHYQRASVFAFPSFREPSGNVVVEAMSHGLPVIVADRGGPPTAVGDGGLVVKADSVEGLRAELRDAIIRLAGDEQLRRRMGNAARDRVRDLFMWDGKIDRMLEVYERVCS